MTKRLPLVVVLAGAAALAAGAAFAADASSDAKKDEAIAAFETVKTVLQHPRCQNCHIPGDAPLQLDEGRVHTLNVLRGADGKGSPGLPCTTCHGTANLPASYGEHMPPGAPNWSLPPASKKMVFIGLAPPDLASH